MVCSIRRGNFYGTAHTMNHQYLSLLPILCSTLLLNICGQSWYSAGFNNNSNNQSIKEEVLNYEKFFTNKIQHLTESEAITASENNLNDKKYINKYPNNIEPLQGENIVNENKTIDKKNYYHKGEVNTVYLNHGTDDLSEVIDSSDARNKTKYSQIAFNNTIENVNVFRTRPHKFRRCPNLRPNKRKSNPNRVRGKKFLEVFQIVEFEHDICSSSSGLEGKCLHEYECKSSGGAPMGDCADGYGTCCVCKYYRDLTNV